MFNWRKLKSFEVIPSKNYKCMYKTKLILYVILKQTFNTTMYSAPLHRTLSGAVECSRVEPRLVFSLIDSSPRPIANTKLTNYVNQLPPPLSWPRYNNMRSKANYPLSRPNTISHNYYNYTNTRYTEYPPRER